MATIPSELTRIKDILDATNISISDEIEIYEYAAKLQEENEQLKKCNKESIAFLNQDDIRDVLMQKDYKLFDLQQKIDKAIQYMEEHPRDFMDEACGGDGVDVVVSILRGEE